MSEASTTAKAPSRAARIGLWLGPAWLLMTLLVPAPAGMPPAAWACAGMTLFMATWWATEAIPIPVTALLPLVLVPALGIGSMGSASAEYGNPVIFLFLGGFLLAIALQRWNLHRRIALRVLLVVGQEPTYQVAGFMLATGFVSMWVSNTATAIMMLPIAISVIERLAAARDSNDEGEVSRYATALLLAVAYAASIGGIATLIGTPPNALLAGYLAKHHGMHIGFAQWMLIGLPVSAVMMLLAWWWLTRSGFRIDTTNCCEQVLCVELERLGPLTTAERRIGGVFVLTAAAWIARPVLNDVGLPWLSDNLISLLAGISLFLLPSGQARGVRLLDWDHAKTLPWDILLLFGGGLAMAGAIEQAGLAGWIAAQLGEFGWLPSTLLIGALVLMVTLLTEFTSNTTTAATFLPLLGALAVSTGIDPLLLAVPATIAASCAFMMPISTPPNAVVFGSGRLTVGAMMRAGLFLNVAGSVAITLLVTALLRLFWL
ncbi:MAG TPA: SLC13 family permease [Noviherbaspirillum sp.]